MGDYAYHNGQHIKVGTCGDMYYLRPDQIDLVEFEGLMNLKECRFRFPFPHEDGAKPGEFDDHNWGFRVRGVEPPASIDHYRVQFKATRGILISLPCPYSEEGKSSGIKYMFNGYQGPAKVVQQRMWEGHWATVMQCGACDAKWRLSELADAMPVIDALVTEADQFGQEEGRARVLLEMALRVRRGYPPEQEQEV